VPRPLAVLAVSDAFSSLELGYHLAAVMSVMLITGLAAYENLGVSGIFIILRNFALLELSSCSHQPELIGVYGLPRFSASSHAPHRVSALYGS
jgi:hypothetical protein